MINLITGIRGTVFGRFADRYNAPCIIVQAEAARSTKMPYIRLGIEDADGLQIHLDQSNAADLIPLLQAFVDTGKLSPPSHPPDDRQYRLVVATNALADLEEELAKVELEAGYAARCERLRRQIAGWRKTIEDLGHQP